jgi:hypothetical protein
MRSRVWAELLNGFALVFVLHFGFVALALLLVSLVGSSGWSGSAFIWFLTLLGLTQLLYVLPIMRLYWVRGNRERVKGMAIAAIGTMLLNGSCYLGSLGAIQIFIGICLSLVSLLVLAALGSRRGWAMTENFWVSHRNYVIDRHYGRIIRRAESIANVGDDLLMAHCDRKYRKKIDGFNIDAMSLNQSVGHYDLMFLLTVLETVEDEMEFLTAVKAQLKPGGRLIVDLSMQSWLYSRVDRRLGRLRRYDTGGGDRII